MFYLGIIRFLKFLCIFILTNGTIASDKKDCTEVARDDETLLVFSTLGGGLMAIDPLTGVVRWNIDDEPAVKVPFQTEQSIPQYLPDPRDGSLYQLGDMGGLKKLPYTIPQLVASAPCKSSDGILFSGKKKDTWFLIDPKTGQREKVLGFGAPSAKSDSIGWATSRAVYLGRTQYTVLMYDSLSMDKNTKPWNVTFFDYAAHTMAPEISKDYEWLHLCGSSNGLTVTLDRMRGSFLWQQDLMSPVVGVFLLNSDGLLSVPFTTVSDEALKNIVDFARDGQKNDVKLLQSLYIGEHTHGLYALPSLVDKNQATISSDPPVKLLDGPDGNAVDINHNLIYLNALLEKGADQSKNVIILGHYQMPKIESDLKLHIATGLGSDKTDGKGLIGKSGNYDILNLNKDGDRDAIISPENESVSIGIQTDDENGFIADGSTNQILKNIIKMSRLWLNDQESKILKLLLIILMGMVVAMFWYMRLTVRELKQQSQSGSQTSNQSKGSGTHLYQELIDLGNGSIQVGKIAFNSNEVLGKGCEGTFVFKGMFEKRNVAVKRLLPDCFTLADREVSLLRESDAHENVVRYFCMEEDRQFRYIALELCAATLQDYTKGQESAKLKSAINVVDVLQQATKGLMHLHSLNIVHRDIKPQNVLLSLPDGQSIVRAMISDFGLCKKLNIGKASFSRRSGITGTEGWIAPEMLKGQRTTTSVDIFSMGCVFYYVISSGKHPFGEPVKRQLNILSNEFNLKYFSDVPETNSLILAEELIADMICKDPNKRPTTKAILNHPYFWTDERILNFLQDTSDRVEKLDYSIQPLKMLEKNSRFIVRNDWNDHLDDVLTIDLKKFRGYQGASVRDLLRAVRNKKHHYHELTVEMQSILGTIPIDFTEYWLSKFPRLLSHTYHAMEQCASNAHFKLYYNKSYTFTKPEYFQQQTEDFVPQDPPTKNRSSPSYSKEMRQKRSNNLDGIITAQFSPNKSFNYTKNHRGSYNFHRKSNDLTGDSMDLQQMKTNFNTTRRRPIKDEIPWTMNS